jgi:hypothetical protein
VLKPRDFNSDFSAVQSPNHTNLIDFTFERACFQELHFGQLDPPTPLIKDSEGINGFIKAVDY